MLANFTNDQCDDRIILLLKAINEAFHIYAARIPIHYIEYIVSLP